MSLSATGSVLNRFTLERNNHMRNDADIERYWVQFAYISLLPFSIIEVIFTQALRLATYVAGAREYHYFNELASSSLYSLLWTIDCIFMNLCSKRLYANERAYINFISHFSWQTFCARFSQDESRQELRLEPLTVPSDVKILLEDYEIGPGAMEYSPLFEMLYDMLPEAAPEEISALPNEMGNLMSDWENVTTIVKKLQVITGLHAWTELNQRFNKMLVFTKNTVLASKNPDDLPNFKNQFAGVFRACVNRMSTEMEKVFFQFAAPSLFEKIQADLRHKSQTDQLAGADGKFFELIYKMISKPDKEEIETLIGYIIEQAEEQHSSKNLPELIGFLMQFTDQPYEDLDEGEKQFIRMLLYTKKVTSLDATTQSLFINTLLNNPLDVETNQTLFFQYAFAELLENADRECLLYDFSLYREDLSKYVMQRILANEDIATHINYFALKLHSKFGLPRPPLSAVDHNHYDAVKRHYRDAIIAGFNRCYLSTHTIYAFFYDIICPKQDGEKNNKRFQQDMYLRRTKGRYYEQAKANGTLPEGVKSVKEFQLPAEAYNEDLTGPNPKDVIEFLTQMKFYKKKKVEEGEWLPMQ